MLIPVLDHLRNLRLDYHGVETRLDLLANLRRQVDGSVLAKPFDPATTSYIQAVLNDEPGVTARRDLVRSYCIVIRLD